MSLCAVGLSAQAQDKLLDSLSSYVSERPIIIDQTHCLKPIEVVIPAVLVSVSAMSIDNGFLRQCRSEVQNTLSNKGRDKIGLDDYVQYSPMIASYAIDLCGIKAKHKLKDRLLLNGMSYIAMGVTVNVMKLLINEKRPDTEAKNSFPSGHTATVFMGAEILRKEYGQVSPYISYSGYAIAIVTGYLRIYNDRHYINDVIAGACIGILSTKFSYWLYPKIYPQKSCGKCSSTVILPYCSSEELGLVMSINLAL